MLKKLFQTTWGKIGIMVLGFVIWMTFFDRNNWMDQGSKNEELRQLEEDKTYYTSQIELLKQNREALFNSNSHLEQYARERYKMKKENEDIFVIVDESASPKEKKEKE